MLLVLYIFSKLSVQVKQQPGKGESVDRLGIGNRGLSTNTARGRASGGVSHSIAGGVRAINQEGVTKTTPKSAVDRTLTEDWEIIDNARFVNA